SRGRRAVSGQASNNSGQQRATYRSDQGVDGGFGNVGGTHRNQVPLTHERHEREPIFRSGGVQAESCISAARRDRRGDRCVRVLLGRVAGERSRRDAFVLEVTIDQKSRSGAALAIDESQAALRKIAEALHPLRVAAFQDESLIPLGEADEAVAARRKKTQIRLRSRYRSSSA